MKLLLDTHALLWMSAAHDRLSSRAAEALLDERHTLLVSVASWWEIGVKVGLGKLTLQPDWPAALKREMRRNGIEWLQILPEHCERVQHLPSHHRDPFDRLLIAQALAGGLNIVTADAQFALYGLDVIW